jgi:hypothetical protein
VNPWEARPEPFLVICTELEMEDIALG